MSSRTPGRSPRKSARGRRPAPPPHEPIELPGAGASPALKSARSPGGTRTLDMHLAGAIRAPRAGGAGAGAGAGAGEGGDEGMTEAQRVALWRAQLAEDSDEDSPGGFSDPDADAVLAKFGADEGPGEKFQGEFEWGPGFQQVQVLTQQNQALTKQLDDKDVEIERLQDVLIATEPIPGLEPERLLDIRVGTDVIDQDARDVKIMDLAKKLRGMNLQLQREKTRASALEAERDQFKEVAESKVYPQRLKPAPAGSSEANTMAERLKKAESKARGLASRLNEYRVKADRFESEVKKTRNALRKEVGPKADLDKVVEEGSNWRGRAQKIVMMRTKIKELESRLADRPTRQDVDAKARAEIQAMEAERARGVEQLSEELERAQHQAVTYKKKMEKAKARTAVLERDNKKARENISTLLKKTGTDDQLIDALRQEVHESRRRMASMTADLNTTRSDLARTTAVKGAKVLEADEYERLVRQNKERHRQLEHQEKIISSLRGELRNARKAAQGRGGGGRRPGSGRSGSGAPRPARPSSAELAARARSEMESEHTAANLKVLQLDNAKQAELINLLKSKVADAEANAETAIARAADLDTLCAQYEGQMNIQRGGLPARTTRKPTKRVVEDLTAQIRSLEEENRALRRTYRTSLQARDDEIATLRDQMQRMGRQFTTKHAGASSRTGGSGAAGDDRPSSEVIEQLKQDKAILVQELTDVRAQYRQLAVRARSQVPER